MKITKLGHCCMLIEEKGLRILTDPGNFSTDQNQVKNIDIVLITHEHADHFHLDSLHAVMANNPKLRIVTNTAVGALLDKEGISYEILEDGQDTVIAGVKFEGFGRKHEIIYQEFGMVENTGYFISDRFFYPGDAYTNPHKPVEILALPVAGPWVKIADAVDYAKAVRPKLCFPVHDGALKIIGGNHRVPDTILNAEGISFKVFELGKEYEV